MMLATGVASDEPAALDIAGCGGCDPAPALRPRTTRRPRVDELAAAMVADDIQFATVRQKPRGGTRSLGWSPRG